MILLKPIATLFHKVSCFFIKKLLLFYFSKYLILNSEDTICCMGFRINPPYVVL